MAKKKIFVIEHLDSFHKEEISEDDYNALQPRIQAKYKIKSTKEAAETPAEVTKNN